jgi:hypothetical protein
MRVWPVLLLLAACKVKDPPPVTEMWTDAFDRETIGGNYYKTGPGFAVTDGAMSAHGGHNHPLWLRKKLPRDVRIEFDCWSNEPRGDIKIELFGDGKSFDPDGGAYTATGYEVIFGGWYNSKSIIARLDEHGKDVIARQLPKVVAKQHYHWKIERLGKTVKWFVAGTAPPFGGAAGREQVPAVDDMQTPFLLYDDPHPLEGTGHEYFGFNNWETDTWFDNLVITPL